ncbi:MAG: magnesium transporter [Gammaproteobacteria bacterium]|nr:magnesium transporter [Gammaproteobacteria bacterium]
MSLTAALHRSFIRQHPGAAVRVVDNLKGEELGSAVRAVADHDPVLLLPVLDRLPPGRALEVFRLLAADAKERILLAAGPRLAVTLLGALSPQERQATLEPLPASMQREFERLLAFPDDSAGRLMDRAYDVARPWMSATELRARLRESDLKRVRSVYVVDDDRRLLGRLDMQDLALADENDLVEGLMQPAAGMLELATPRAEIVVLLEDTRLDSLPVVDLEQRLMGVVRYTSLYRAIEAEANLDIQTMVGVSADERALSPFGFVIRRRLPWLHVNLLTAFLAASVVGLFEHTIAQFTALAVLMPVVAGMSGNAGAQALAVTIRGLALREIGIGDWRRLLFKEQRAAFVNGIALALSCGIGVLLWSQSPGLALVIGIAMILGLMAAATAGALVPILLTRFGQDPATASSILLTTVTDVFGFFAFLGTATLLSGLL